MSLCLTQLWFHAQVIWSWIKKYTRVPRWQYFAFFLIMSSNVCWNSHEYKVCPLLADLFHIYVIHIYSKSSKLEDKNKSCFGLQFDVRYIDDVLTIYWQWSLSFIPHDYGLFLLPDLEIQLTVGVTGSQQGILTPPRYFIAPLVYPEAFECSILWFLLQVLWDR
jgi:hypothetical protein